MRDSFWHAVIYDTQSSKDRKVPDIVKLVQEDIDE